MRIPFRRIAAEAQPFRIEREGIVMEGGLRTYRPKLVLLEATLSGRLNVECYRCAASFDIMLGEEIAMLLSDGVFHGQDEEFDVVEMYDGIIDLDEVLASEIALIESDYHACPQCV